MSSTRARTILVMFSILFTSLLTLALAWEFDTGG